MRLLMFRAGGGRRLGVLQADGAEVILASVRSAMSGGQFRLNGTVKQDGNTRDMIYPVDAIIEWASKGMTLFPGSMIATGTPDGVGFARTPPDFLKPGDVTETEVEGIGLLRSKIAAAVDE